MLLLPAAVSQECSQRLANSRHILRDPISLQVSFSSFPLLHGQQLASNLAHSQPQTRLRTSWFANGPPSKIHGSPRHSGKGCKILHGTGKRRTSWQSALAAASQLFQGSRTNDHIPFGRSFAVNYSQFVTGWMPLRD